MDYFPPGTARKVTGGIAKFVVGQRKEGAPKAMKVLCADKAGIIRFVGGTSNDTVSGEAALRFTEAVFSDGKLQPLALMSGGTRIVNDRLKVIPGILEMPGLAKLWNPDCVALGSVPRTSATMSYQGEHSSLMLSDIMNDSMLPNPTLDMLWVVQYGVNDTSGWDGDVEVYLEFMDNMRQDAGLVPATICWNGGLVTAKEIRGALEYGFHCLLIEGSGRFTDAAIAFKRGKQVEDAQFRTILGKWHDSGVELNFDIIRHDDPNQVKQWLTAHGLRR
ncbi:MAG TPA: hypothetical protein VD907_04315 [Verrucomicrobiae bacterium]|nr:hypothetical protein [Verrucomicrobiae bacterium]